VNTLLPEIAALLGAATALPVRVAQPSPANDGVFVWPWRAIIEHTARVSSSPRARPGAGRGPVPVQIELLLVAQQADSAQALSTLLVCGRALEANPVFRGSGIEGRVRASVLSHSELCAVFLASGLRLQPCLSYSLTLVDAAADPNP
jgi:hypothetical protein